MQKRMNKKAQDLSIGTLILIVLGIIVLVLLILGFSLGWANLWEKINIFQGNPIGDASQACALAVTSNNVYGYCQEFKEITLEGKTQFVNCEDARVQSGFNGRLQCDTNAVNQAMKDKCKSLNDKDKQEAKFNNAGTCNQRYNFQTECAAAGGQLQQKEGSNCNKLSLASSSDAQVCCETLAEQ